MGKRAQKAGVKHKAGVKRKTSHAKTSSKKARKNSVTNTNGVTIRDKNAIVEAKQNAAAENKMSLAEYFALKKGGAVGWNCTHCTAPNDSEDTKCKACEKEQQPGGASLSDMSGTGTATATAAEGGEGATPAAVGATGGTGTPAAVERPRSGSLLGSLASSVAGFVLGGYAVADEELPPVPVPEATIEEATMAAGEGNVTTTDVGALDVAPPPPSNGGAGGFVFGGVAVPPPQQQQQLVPAGPAIGAAVPPPAPEAEASNPGGPIDWAETFILGEQIHTGKLEKIRKGGWDFSHLAPQISQTLTANPDCHVFLFGTSPELLNFGPDRGLLLVPSVCAILVKGGNSPPELVAVRDFQRGGEQIIPFRQLKLKWQPLEGWNSRVFTLQGMLRNCSMKNMTEHELFTYEYSTLYYNKPSVDWGMDQYGKINVRHTMFEYASDDLKDSPVHEEFNKDDGHRLETFVPDFCERNDLGYDDHRSAVEEAIRAAFVSERELKRSKIKLFDGYDRDVLENMRVVKIYPKNDFVLDDIKFPAVNEYFGKAEAVV